MANQTREKIKKELKSLNIEIDNKKSTIQLEKMLNAAKADLENTLKNNETENSNIDDEILIERSDSESSNDSYDDEILIERLSSCGNYKAVIRGIEETARRSGVTVEEIREALDNNVLVKGMTFKEA